MGGAPNRALWQVAGGGNLMEGTDGVPPEEAIGQMATGYWISQVIRTMAVLGLADHLAAGARTTSCGPCPPSVCVSATTRVGSV